MADLPEWEGLAIDIADDSSGGEAGRAGLGARVETSSRPHALVQLPTARTVEGVWDAPSSQVTMPGLSEIPTEFWTEASAVRRRNPRAAAAEASWQLLLQDPTAVGNQRDMNAHGGDGGSSFIEGGGERGRGGCGMVRGVHDEVLQYAQAVVGVQLSAAEVLGDGSGSYVSAPPVAAPKANMPDKKRSVRFADDVC